MAWTVPCLGIRRTATEKIWLIIEPIISFSLVCMHLRWLLDLKAFQRPSLNQLSMAHTAELEL